jgi:putative ABC transport system permease protein
MRALRFAWLSLVRQPVRSLLGILGVAAVAALLFDMLLLSRGLVISFGELLDRSGFDVRVLATDAPPLTGPPLTGAAALVTNISALPEIEAVLQLRIHHAEIVTDGTSAQPGMGTGPAREDGTERRAQSRHRQVDFIGADPRVRSMWTVVEGRDLPDQSSSSSSLVINRQLARRLGVAAGASVSLRGQCGGETDARPPVTFSVVGIADFPFDSVTDRTAAATLADADRLCGDESTDRAELLLVRSRPGAGAVAASAAISAAHPGLHVVTNEELVERFSRVEFAYFRQISTVLATITLFFGFLLIAVLLTVSVNQRLGEIAALRAVGLSRSRVVAGVLWESVMLVGAGAILALPLGAALSTWLDAILRALPGLPADLRFFVFEPRALVLYAAMLAIASVAAAAYPMRIVAVLPIAATLRREVVS